MPPNRKAINDKVFSVPYIIFPLNVTFPIPKNPNRLLKIKTNPIIGSPYLAIL